MATTLYGIGNCDTVKKAKKWLDTHGVEYDFHDLKKDGLDVKQVSRWSRSLGWKNMLNTRGTTWRNLSEEDKQNLSENKSIKLMLNNPSIIKRPILHYGSITHLGFDEDEYKELFG
ncbi:MAG: ArsC family reductase [Gammaproteobacteria bacterium]|nr:MAG: ArsC family reductase [Gammaproteobacteria bacterium]